MANFLVDDYHVKIRLISFANYPTLTLFILQDWRVSYNIIKLIGQMLALSTCIKIYL